MMFARFLKIRKLAEPVSDALQVGSRIVPLSLVHHPRARRYLLRLRSDGSVRVTVPRRGSISAARDFARQNLAWLEKQFQQLEARPQISATWKLGGEILFRGEPVRLEGEADGAIRFGTEQVKVADNTADLRPPLQKFLWRLAAQELPPRVMELASRHGVQVSRVSVRNQRSRWGSCSRRGTISLNWRLIQAPGFVRDYIILHELAHRREMNHSDKFWQEVARLCPEYQPAERWLKAHANLLR